MAAPLIAMGAAGVGPFKGLFGYETGGGGGGGGDDDFFFFLLACVVAVIVGGGITLAILAVID